MDDDEFPDNRLIGQETHVKRPAYNKMVRTTRRTPFHDQQYGETPPWNVGRKYA